MKNILTLKLTLPLVFSLLLLASCKKEINESEQLPILDATSFEEMNIPSNFTFQTTHKVNFEAHVALDNYPTDAKYVVEVYLDNPSNGAPLFYKGITSEVGELYTNFKLPTYKQSIWVVSKYGSMSMTKKIDVNSSNVSADFYSSGKRSSSSTSNQPDCNSGNTMVLSGTGSVNLNTGDVASIKAGTTFTGAIKFKGNATLKVCGTANLTQLNFNGNAAATIIVGASGSFNSSHLNMNSSSSFTNYGNSINIVNGPLSVDYDFTNYGNINLVGANVQNTGALYNHGTINFSTNLNCNEYVENNGTIIVSGHVNVNGQGTLVNNCKLEVLQHFNQNNNLENYGYIKAHGDFHFNGSSQSTLGSNSYIETNNLHVNNVVTGPSSGNYAAISVASSTTINGSASIVNKVDLCDANGIETNNGTLGNEVVFCSAYIPSNGNCNPGYGVPTVTDSDNDGVDDDNDDFPNDPDKAFKSYYPGEGVYGTHAFEDLWPNKGDFDFNDLVLNYNYEIHSNADNKVVELNAAYLVRAMGAGFQNGFGVQLPIASNQVASVTGYSHVTGSLNIAANGTEAGQSGTVLMIYDNISNFMGGSILNTVAGEPFVSADTTRVKVTFTTPQNSIGTAPYNPFIYVDQDRGREVHQINSAPTSLVNNSFYGSGDDASNPGSGVYYRTAQQFPWAIDIPVTFDYMKEKEDIVTGHLKFDDWAQSGGTQFTDWYLNQSGYRNNNKIY